MFGPLRSSHLYILSFCVFWIVWAIQIQLSPDPFWTICFCEVLSKCSHALLISWALLSFSGEKLNCLTLITCLKCRNIALYCVNGSLWTYYWIAHTTSFILTRHRRTSQLIIGLVGLFVFYLDRSSMCTNNGAIFSKYKTACDCLFIHCPTIDPCILTTYPRACPSCQLFSCGNSANCCSYLPTNYRYFSHLTACYKVITHYMLAWGFWCLMCKPLWQKLCSLEPG